MYKNLFEKFGPGVFNRGLIEFIPTQKQSCYDDFHDLPQDERDCVQSFATWARVEKGVDVADLGFVDGEGIRVNADALTLWLLLHEWGESEKVSYRVEKLNYVGDHGWLRHLMRLLHRYQMYLIGIDTRPWRTKLKPQTGSNKEKYDAEDQQQLTNAWNAFPVALQDAPPAVSAVSAEDEDEDEDEDDDEDDEDDDDDDDDEEDEEELVNDYSPSTDPQSPSEVLIVPRKRQELAAAVPPSKKPRVDDEVVAEAKRCGVEDQKITEAEQAIVDVEDAIAKKNILMEQLEEDAERKKAEERELEQVDEESVEVLREWRRVIVRDRNLRNRWLDTIAGEQDGKCNDGTDMCPWGERKVPRDCQHLEHIRRKADKGNDKRSNLQMFCACCHARKSIAECRRGGSEDPQEA